MLKQETDLPRSGRLMEERLDILMDELYQAFSWSRPSLLFALHRSKSDQSRTVHAMERKLKASSMNVLHIDLESEPVNILGSIAQKMDSQESVIFIHDLGSRLPIYDGLNMFRELIVEQRLKIIFWLTVEELSMLSRRAPDFWAFRHRVIEFPSRRRSAKNALPAGVLIWPYKNDMPGLERIRAKIEIQGRLVNDISPRGGTIPDHAHALGNLAYYYWLAGETQQAGRLLQSEIEQVEWLHQNDVHSMLLNMYAICCFDQDEYSDAFAWMEKALELCPGQGMFWSNHGVICRSAGESRKSFPSLRRATRLNPLSPESRGVLGYIYMSLGNFNSALHHFEGALAMEPGSAHYFPALAFCHSQLGNVDEFAAIVRKISDKAQEGDFQLVYRDGLLGKTSVALTRLKELTLAERIPTAHIRRDPNLHFIFGAAALETIG